MAGDDMNTRTRLNWETARKWSYALEYLLKPYFAEFDDSEARVCLNHLNSLIAQMRREVE